MNDREKLIEIIGLTEYGNGALVGKNFQRGFIGKIADHLIANGVTVQKWIPVSERLPDKNDKYIVFLKYVKTITVMNFALDFVVHDEYGLPTKEKKSCFYYCDDDWELI